MATGIVKKGVFFDQHATGARIIHWGGDNGVQLRIYSNDNTVYAITFFVNGIQLQTSTDGETTWTNRWFVDPFKIQQ